MKKAAFFLFIIFWGIVQIGCSDPLEVYFGPAGGFSVSNNSRKIVFSDGKTVAATLQNAVLDMIKRTDRGDTIKICTYSMSDFNTLDALIEAARDRGVKIKLLLDAAADWTAAARDKIVTKVREAKKEAEAAGIPFDFQIKIVTKETMAIRGRLKKLPNGKTVYGTMHEKFGIFYRAGDPVPKDGFCGSANLSFTSDQIYGENRVVFIGRPALARQFQEEFARLWNEFGVGILGPCHSEIYLPASPVRGEVQVFFNSRPVDESNLVRLDKIFADMIRMAGKKGGSLDIGMFSFTNPRLAQEVIDAARLNPNARFRLLLDLSQIDDSDKEDSIQGPWMEREAARLRLTNLQIRYKWRSNAFGWNPETASFEMMSLRNLFWHHKVMVVNEKLMAMGSYNLSGSAEELNFENVMIFDADQPEQKKIIQAFMNEFETVWNSRRPSGRVEAPLKGIPQSVTGPEGRALQKRILSLICDEKNWKIVQSMDRGTFVTFEELLNLTQLSRTDLLSRLDQLIEASLLCKCKKDGVAGYMQAD